MLAKWHRQKPEFAEPDRLTRAIQCAIDELEAEGVIDPEVENADPEQDRYEGYCARSAQAYWRLTKAPAYRALARDPDVEPYVLRDEGEQPHYWIRVRTTGEVLDLNYGPDDTPDRHYPYMRGEPWRKFQPDPAGSNWPRRIDARLIMERVMANEAPARAPARTGRGNGQE